MSEKTIRRFRQCIRHLERELEIQNNSCSSYGVSLVQCHALLAIESSDSVNLGELAGKLFLDKSTVSRTVESLVKNKLVNRYIPDDNRRKVQLSLTGRGNEVCERINRDNDAYFSDVLGALPPGDVEVFLRSLESIIGRMNETNGTLEDDCRI